MMSRAFAALGVIAVVWSSTACSASKSDNPLSPSVAGPIPGVQISAPKMLEPQSGSKIAIDKQPVTMLIENAGSTGPRPLTYTFEIATDTGFSNKVFTRDGIAQGDGGRSRRGVEVDPDPLEYASKVQVRAVGDQGRGEVGHARDVGSQERTLAHQVPGRIEAGEERVLR